MVRRLALVFTLALASLSAACGSPMRLEVNSLPTTNAGAPLYAVVRRVSKDQFAIESYDEASAQVFQNPPSGNVLKAEVLFPGRKLLLEVPKEQEEDLAIYFFFTQPGARFGHSILRPMPGRILIDLGDREIGSVKEDR